MRASVLAVLTACSYAPQPGTAPGDSVGPGDGAEPDGPINANCFGQFGTVCLQTLPRAPFSIGNTTSTVMTDTLASCEMVTNGTNVTGCVISGTSMTIDGNLIGQGARPLILIATEGPLVVDNLIDVASHRDPIVRGAGANPNGACNGAQIATDDAGGPGGTLGGAGGDGGAGEIGLVVPAAAAAAPTSLRGGCQGGAGGTASASTDGGHGGGALWLVSKERITINGVINASGAGGAGGAGDALDDHGGAGGGSGGMIVLDAPVIEIGGVVLAIGGGGGGGSDGVFSGDDGADPNPANPGQPALGGQGVFGDFGGDGGTTGDGQDGDSDLGATGSGGGGGTGHVRAFGTVSGSGAVFPAISAN